MTYKIWTVSGFAAGALASGCGAVEVAALGRDDAILRVEGLLRTRGHATAGLSAEVVS